MSERLVTAVVLLSGATTASTLRATTAAVAAQTRPPDLIVAVAPSTLEDEVLDRLEGSRGRGEIDEVVTTAAALSRAGAVREVLELLSRRPAGRSPGGQEGPTGEAAGAGSRERPAGRRALDVDPEAVERRRTQDAEKLARVPLRLREERRSGRRAAGESAGRSWLWFVVDESLPSPSALERQAEMATRSPNTAVIGPKRVRSTDPAGPVPSSEAAPADRADALVDVGLTLTHGGRIITGVDPGEVDQGQADWRQDVLAVALPGMLIREQTLREVGGLDPDLPTPWAEIDLCHRVWRHGERVAVQARARVLFPASPRPPQVRMREHRTGQLLLLLKHRPVLMAALMLLLSPLTTLLRVAGAIITSVPRRALIELRAWWAALGRAPRVIRRGARERRRARVPRGRLAPLYLPRGEGLRRRLDDAWTRMFADDERHRRIRRTTWGIAGTRHGIDDADYGRHVVWTAVVAVTATVLSLVALRGLFGRGRLDGPGLLPLPDSWSASWEAAWASWVPGGLGARGPGDPWVRLLGHLPVPGATLVEVVVFSALPLAALAAWWSSGAITRAVGARLALTVAWTLAPSLITALAAGAWPLLIVHALLPLLALAIGRAIGLPHKVSQASVGAAGAAGMLLLVIGAVQPVLVVLTALALVLLAPSVPGRRRRLAWVLIPSLALHAPYLGLYLDRPAALLAVGGVPPLTQAPTLGDLLMLWPQAPEVVTSLSPLLGEQPAAVLPLLPVLPVLAAALPSPLLAGAAGRAGRFSVLVASACVVAVALARQTMVAVSGDSPVAAPLHALLSATLLALMIGAGASFDALARRESSDGRARRAATSAAGVLVAAACLVTTAGWTLLLPGELSLDRVAAGQVPAAAADQGRTEARTRVLVLEPDPEQDGEAVRASLVVHGGDSIIQRAAVTDLREVESVRAGRPLDADPGSTTLREAVATMLSSGASADEAATSTLAVGYLIVPGDPSEQLELVRTLDASDSLEKVTESAGGGMWRVIDAAPRAVVRGGEQPVDLASGVVEAGGSVPADNTERTVVLSERYDTQWRATVEGTELEPVRVDDWAQGFLLPAGASGEILVGRDQPWTLAWQITLYAAVTLTVLIAVPWRPRSRVVEEMYG